jgi:formylglycine-generating enzyme required for sulfatase activity
LQKYRQTLVDTLEDEEYPFDEVTQNVLKEYQIVLGLRDEDVEAIALQVLPQSTPSTVRPIIIPTPTPVAPAAPQSFTLDLSNTVKLEMIAIPGGSFWMGSPDGVGKDNERPRHQVTIAPFWISKYPITQAQYQAIIGKNPSNFKGDQRPVENVSWWEAIAFCEKLGEKGNRIFRLPSEAEWEYACRAGTETPFYFGETITTDLANYRGTDWEYQGKVYPGNYGAGPKGEFREQTTNVGIFPSNSFGLYDMHGNVWEWCADHWHENYNGAPPDGSAWLTHDKDTSRLLRGGSWGNVPGVFRSAFRNPCSPDLPGSTVGFRWLATIPNSLDAGQASLKSLDRLKWRKLVLNLELLGGLFLAQDSSLPFCPLFFSLFLLSLLRAKRDLFKNCFLV